MKERSERTDEVKSFPATPGVVRVNAPGHTEQARQVHRVEGHVEADGEKPEMPESQLAVEQPTGGLRIPVVKACEDSEEESADQHIVKVRDYEVRIRELPVEGNDA